MFDGCYGYVSTDGVGRNIVLDQTVLLRLWHLCFCQQKGGTQITPSPVLANWLYCR